MLNCNLNAICPSYVPWAYPVTREGHISSHLVFPEKKQAKWTTQGSNLRDEKRTAGLLHKTNFLLIQHCHHCDHSEDFLWSCIAITAIILLISSCQCCDHSEDFLWCCIAVFWLRLAILVIIAKCSSVAASVFEYQEGCEPSIPAELRKNLEQSWKVTKWSYLIFVSHPWPDLTCL